MGGFVGFISYGADGSIPSISKTSEGVTESAEPMNPFARVEAETIAWEEGIETEPCSEGGMNVTEISDGDYIKVEAVEFGDPFTPASRGWITKDRTAPGHIGDPRTATAEKGEALLRSFADDVVRLLERVIAWDGRSWSG